MFFRKLCTNLKATEEKNIMLPPWLWLWLVIYALGIPSLTNTVLSDLHNIFGGTIYEVLNSKTPSVPEPFTFLYRITYIEDIFFYLALFLGVLSVFLPWIRASWLERRFNLNQPVPTISALNEICDFIHQYANDVQIKANLLRSDQLAFVYPLNYQSTAIAIFGGLVKLWRSNRQVAEAILLHEIAHHRHRDTLILGAGSFFGTVLKNWLFIYILIAFLPLFLEPILDMYMFDMRNNFPFSLSSIFIREIPWDVVELFREPIWTLSLFILPLIGVWCAELNADRFVINVTKSSQTLHQALEQFSIRSSWSRWLLFRMSHPPNRFRRWIACQLQGTRGFIWFLLLFPLANLVALLALAYVQTSDQLSQLYNYSSTGEAALFIIQTLGSNILTSLESTLPVWLAIAILLLLWRHIASYWELLFERSFRASLLRSILLGSLLIFYSVSVISAINQTTAEANKLRKHFQIGDQVQTDRGSIITIVNVQTDQGNTDNAPKPGDTYLVIALSFKNISAEAQNANPLDYSLYDIDGKEYFSAYDPQDSLWNGSEVKAGDSIRVEIVFEVPLSIQKYTLSYDDNNTGTPQVIWDLKIRTANITLGATPIPTPTPTPKPESLAPSYEQAVSGTPEFSDPLTANDLNNWDSKSITGKGSCKFIGGAYHISMDLKNQYAFCLAHNTNFSNFTIQVRMTIIAGDMGGIVFRAHNGGTDSSLYFFGVGQDGSYGFGTYTRSIRSYSSDESSSSTVAATISIKRGLNQVNVMTVVAHGSTITFYVNGIRIDTVSDSSFTSGAIGLYAFDNMNTTEVTFSNLQVWQA
jgi:hypothetical protein